MNIIYELATINLRLSMIIAQMPADMICKDRAELNRIIDKNIEIVKYLQGEKNDIPIPTKQTAKAIKQAARIR